MATLAEIDAEIARRKTTSSLPNVQLSAINEEIQRRGITDDLLRRSDSDTSSVPDQQLLRSPTGALEQAIGVGEAGLSLASGAIGEIAGGVAGLVTSLIPGTAEGSGAGVSERVAETLTFEPLTEAGKDIIGGIGETLQPAIEAFTAAEDILGDETLKATNSPALAALAKTAPTLALELTGFAGAKSINKLAKDAAASKIARQVEEATPSIEQLKDTSREVYKELDELGVTVRPKAYRKLVTNLRNAALKMGVDPDITPKSFKALKRFEDSIGSLVTLSDLDTLRKVAQNAAGDITNKGDAAIGMAIIDSVDNFLDTSGVASLNKPKGVNVGERYKVARDLWGRSRRSELIGEAFTKAKTQASGFENGIRIQFRQILNNKKQRKFFKPEELKMMSRVVEGGKGENLARFFGRFAPVEGSAHNILASGAGIAGGAAVAGPVGAIVVPALGTISRKLAARMTAKNAEFADQFIRAGTDARRITAAYNRNTPKPERSAQELSELLMDPDIDFSGLKDPIAIEAASIAKRNIEGGLGVAAGLLKPEEDENLL